MLHLTTLIRVIVNRLIIRELEMDDVGNMIKSRFVDPACKKHKPAGNPAGEAKRWNTWEEGETLRYILIGQMSINHLGGDIGTDN